MPQSETLRDLLIDEIRDLYDAERQLIKALPKLARAATSDDLREAIESHLAETQGHAEKLETVFEALGERVRGKHCAGIAGIIEEGSDLINEDFDGAVLDAGIIAGAQRAEHYEITAYGSLIAWANTLGLSDVSSTLQEILAEEKAADKKLSALAEGTINAEAAAEGGEEDDESDSEDEENESRPAASARSAKGNGRSASASSSSASDRGRGTSRLR